MGARWGIDGYFKIKKGEHRDYFNICHNFLAIKTDNSRPKTHPKPPKRHY